MKFNITKDQKDTLLRLMRVFVAGFLASFSVDQFLLADGDLQISLLKGAIAGGLSALMKMWRDNESKDSIVQKSPL